MKFVYRKLSQFVHSYQVPVPYVGLMMFTCMGSELPVSTGPGDSVGFTIPGRSEIRETIAGDSRRALFLHS